MDGTVISPRFGGVEDPGDAGAVTETISSRDPSPRRPKMRSLPVLLSTLSLGAALAWGCGGGDQPTGSSDSTSSSSSSSGSGGGGGGGAAPPGFCDGPTSFLYDPASKQVNAFPDDFFTVDDAASATGLRV